MIRKSLMTLCLFTALAASSTACGRHIRTATDVTPGNPRGEKMDWRYGATDIRIQTTKLTSQLMDRWISKTGFDCSCAGKPRMIITEIDNRTDCYISTDMVRDIVEGVAVDDGRFTILVGDTRNERELDYLMNKITSDNKYQNSSRLNAGNAIAPQFLAKIRITKAITQDRYYDYEDYRMTVTLYDIETQEVIDSAWDVLSKKVKGCAR